MFKNDTTLFCTGGYEFNCPIKHCHKIDKQRSHKFKKKSTLNNYQKNSLILTNWPFSHPPKTTAFDEIKLLNIELTRSNKSQQHCCTMCVDQVFFTKQAVLNSHMGVSIDLVKKKERSYRVLMGQTN